MEHVRLGRSGLKVSRLALGCMTFGDPAWRAWVLDETAARPILEKALDLGITFFDTANMYSKGMSETITGRLLAGLPRSRFVLATKLHFAMGDGPNERGQSRKHIFEAVDSSLKRLGLDCIDLLQIHRFDPETPWEESLDALDDVVRSGRVRYLGASSMDAWRFMKALSIQRANGFAPFISMQNHYNLLYREEEREMLPLCREEGIGVIPWSPLARGFLAGNRAALSAAGTDHGAASVRAKTDSIAHGYYGGATDLGVVAAVERVALRHNVPMARVAYAWVASRPGITAPIVGISKLHQFDDAVAALDLKLTDEDIGELEAPYRPKAVTGHG